MRSTVAVSILFLTVACGQSSPLSPTPIIIAPSILAGMSVAGEWRGPVVEGACDPEDARVRLPLPLIPCSPAVIFPFNHGIRIVLTQNGSMVSAFIQGDIAEGRLTGIVAESGVMSLTGIVSTLTVGSGQSPGRPYLRFTRWRTVVNQTTGQLVGSVAYRTLDASGSASVTEYVNEVRLPFCAAPSVTGVYWEC